MFLGRQVVREYVCGQTGSVGVCLWAVLEYMCGQTGSVGVCLWVDRVWEYICGQTVWDYVCGQTGSV